MDNQSQFLCEQLYSPQSIPSGKYSNQSCTGVAFCQQTGKCEKQGNAADCTNSTRFSCNEKNDTSYIFYPSQQCGATTPAGTCCVETSSSAAQTRPTCLNDVTPTDCQTRLWQYYPRACSTIPNCNEATGTGVPTVVPKDTPLKIDFFPEVPLPNFAGGPITATTLLEYIRAVFILFMWIVGILATVRVIYGGIKWVSAAGNPARINDARESINSAIIGVIIALSSVVLLNIISPQYTQFQGLSIKPVDPKALEIVAAATAAAQDFQICQKSKVAGPPDKACSGKDPSNPKTNQTSNVPFGCIDLNEEINRAWQDYAPSGLDPFALKAIITIESAKLNGNPYSGPERLASGGEGPSYGIGQFKARTLLEQLKKVNKGLPPGCREGEAIREDGTVDDKISQSCRDWLDKREGGRFGSGLSGLEAQVKLIGGYLSQHLEDEKCIKGNIALAAASYNQGLGGARASFCNMDLKGASDERIAEIRANALNYIAKFKTAYTAACDRGK